MSEATLYKDADTIDVVTPADGYASGEVIQLSDGRAAVRDGLRALVEGDPASLRTEGQFTLAKTASVVILEGDLVYWDRSAGTATPLKAVAGADFPVGVAVMDAASTATTVVVDLNKKPVYTIDAMRDPTDTAIVLTAGTPALTMQPGYAAATFSATAEAQKVDILSQASVPVTIPFIVEGRVAIYDIGDNAALDINIGIANGTDATDADAITESVFLHFDGTAHRYLGRVGRWDDRGERHRHNGQRRGRYLLRFPHRLPRSDRHPDLHQRRECAARRAYSNWMRPPDR